MKITLITYTGHGWGEDLDYQGAADFAANMLIFAKSTRLNMTPSLKVDIGKMSSVERMKELAYIANTIPASHEFVDYTFLIEGVTRAFTHQLVRSRVFSFAQQTMRVLDVSEGEGWSYGTGPSIEKDPVLKGHYDSTMDHIDRAYKWLIRDGAKIEDARGILPTNILTNIMMKGNLRNFCELIRKRSSPRTQGEYREVLEGFKSEMLRVHPWTGMFFNRTFDVAAKELDDWISEHGPTLEENTKARKLVDLMRRG